MIMWEWVSETVIASSGWCKVQPLLVPIRADHPHLRGAVSRAAVWVRDCAREAESSVPGVSGRLVSGS